MNTFTCKTCDKQFEDDSYITGMIYEQYGWARCDECEYDAFCEMFGIEESEGEK